MTLATKEPQFLLHKEDALERAVSDYLNVSRNKENKQLFREHNYWPEEERQWQKLMDALERNGIVVYDPSQEVDLDN